MLHFQKKPGHVWTVPWNMHAKFEVSSFNHFGAIGIQRPLHSHAQLIKTMSSSFTPFTWRSIDRRWNGVVKGDQRNMVQLSATKNNLLHSHALFDCSHTSQMKCVRYSV